MDTREAHATIDQRSTNPTLKAPVITPMTWAESISYAFMYAYASLGFGYFLRKLWTAFRAKE